MKDNNMKSILIDRTELAQNFIAAVDKAKLYKTSWIKMTVTDKVFFDICDNGRLCINQDVFNYQYSTFAQIIATLKNRYSVSFVNQKLKG
jgi:hypothetical protein